MIHRQAPQSSQSTTDQFRGPIQDQALTLPPPVGLSSEQRGALVRRLSETPGQTSREDQVTLAREMDSGRFTAEETRTLGRQIVPRLLQSLGSNSSRERENAENTLFAMGFEMRAEIRNGLNSDDIEISRRTERLLERIASSTGAQMGRELVFGTPAEQQRCLDRAANQLGSFMGRQDPRDAEFATRIVNSMRAAHEEAMVEALCSRNPREVQAGRAALAQGRTEREQIHHLQMLAANRANPQLEDLAVQRGAELLREFINPQTPAQRRAAILDNALGGEKKEFIDRCLDLIPGLNVAARVGILREVEQHNTPRRGPTGAGPAGVLPPMQD